MKKVLIAGGGGYVGTRLVMELKDRDYDVTVVDLFWFGNHLPKGVRVIKENAMHLDIEDVRGFDSVIFLAGLSNDPMADFSPNRNFIENTSVPAYLAYISKKAGVKRFIYAGSCSVYGFTDNIPLDEDSFINPQYPYGISKLLGEKGVMTLTDDDFRPISLRQGTIGGWSPRMRFDLVVNTMTRFALETKQITVHNPKLWRPLIDIRDIVSAYVNSIESDLEVTGVYNISYKNYTIGDLAKEIHSTLTDRGYVVDVLIQNKEDVRNYKVDNSRAKKDLNFNPKYSPTDSINDIFDNMNLDKCDFSNKNFYNIQTFKDVVRKWI
tara:strand:+ start:4740 stop:5708 length:969 start_codon:yes stop_codon:yes gene_type:complete